jgi:CMP-N,N'-diacetyllegionaminic acid synthase
MKVIGIIPVRLGSKRLKKKNILPIKGKPMVCWTIDAALGSKYFTKDNLFVSTESEEIKKAVGDRCKVVTRPNHLATDDIWIQPVVNDALLRLPNVEGDDLVVILQGNSPEMEAKVITECIDKVISDELWQLSTVDQEFVNNGHIHVLRKRVCFHKGKANYNGVYPVNWVDIHTMEDYNKAKERLEND